MLTTIKIDHYFSYTIQTATINKRDILINQINQSLLSLK